MLRISRTRAVTAVTAVAVVASTATAFPAAAAGHGDHRTRTLGGSELRRKGIVENPLPGAPPLPTSLPSGSWMITDLTTGQILAAKNAHKKFLPASTLKTLAAAVLLPRLNPRSKFKVTDRDERVGGTMVGLVPDHDYTINKLFQAMLIVSANDAADALSQANGGIKKTVREMNAEAHHLRADDTHADTPSGLDGPGETTTAYDLALIGRHDFAIPAFRHYLSIVHTQMPAPHHKSYQIYTHNNLLTTYRGDIGGKNGYTIAADATYVGEARRHGQTLMVTLMDAYPTWWIEAQSLYNWGFSAIGKVTSVGHLVAPIAAKKPAPLTVTPSVTDAGSERPIASSGFWTSGHDGEIAGVAAIVLLAILYAVRRRRSRRRGRLTLPSW